MSFPLLDLLRGFAALSVLVFHLIGHWEWDAFPDSGPLAWFRSGWMAVDLFFVMSGFVIGLSALQRQQAEGAAFRSGFLRRRLARIAPLHLLTLLVFIVWVEPGLPQQPGFAANLLAHLGFVHNLSFDWHGAINGPNWSVGTEMQFYLLVALAAPWLARAQPWRIALLCVVVAWAWRWAAWLLTVPGSYDRAYMAQTQLPGMLDAFAAGLLLARFVRSDRGQAVLQRLRSSAGLRCGLAGAIALCAWALSRVYMANHFWETGAMAVLFRSALAACAGLVLLLLCAWPAPARPRLLRIPLYLGRISYGIYLWHLPVLLLLARHTGLDPLSALWLATACTLALAAASWELFERPLLRRFSGATAGGHRMLHTPRPCPVPAQACSR